MSNERVDRFKGSQGIRRRELVLALVLVLMLIGTVIAQSVDPGSSSSALQASARRPDATVAAAQHRAALAPSTPPVREGLRFVRAEPVLLFLLGTVLLCVATGVSMLASHRKGREPNIDAPEPHETAGV